MVPKFTNFYQKAWATAHGFEDIVADFGKYWKSSKTP